LFCALALGVLISTIAPSQRIAMIMAITITLLPSVILSGFIFPIRSMPLLIQIITYIIPARYFLVILRGIMLKGSTLDVLWTPTVILAVFGIFLMVVSMIRFHKSMVKA
jgi:ABC-2 type transport system permease protein